MMSERFEDPAEAALTAFVISWPTLAARDGELLERGDQMLRADPRRLETLPRERLLWSRRSG
jgi:hypothetical protein